MAVPKKRTSRSRQGARRSHLALKPVTLIKCENCAKLRTSHAACRHCGFYRGRKLVKV
jgi:large subunit ribosomal protein L32